jgi:hypothetical protein
MTGKLRSRLVQLAIREIAIPRTHGFPVRAIDSMVVDSVVDAAIVKLRGVGVPLADSLPIVLRKQLSWLIAVFSDEKSTFASICSNI